MATFKTITNDDIFNSIQDIHKKLDTIETKSKITEIKISKAEERICNIENIGKVAIGGGITLITGLTIYILNVII